LHLPATDPWFVIANGAMADDMLENSDTNFAIVSK
jgi:hypothetical protein